MSDMRGAMYVGGQRSCGEGAVESGLAWSERQTAALS